MTRALLNPITIASTDWGCPLPSAEVQQLLGSACLRGIRSIVATDTTVHARVRGSHIAEIPGEGGGEASELVEASVPVVVRGGTVATITATGPADAPFLVVQSAELAAARLADAWRSAQEIDSLSGEIVHVYEELYLLYELGEALTGQLTVAQVADVILDKSIHALHAAWGELHLTEGDRLVYSRPRQHSKRPGAGRVDTAHRLHTEIRSGGVMIGQIILARSANAQPFSSSDIKLLDAVGSFAGSAIRNAQLFQEMRRLADTDALTGLANHRAVQEALDDELAKAAAEGYSLGVILIDIDDFKLFNDTYGHLVGDQILRVVSATLRESCRGARDVVGRYGGDEFVMVLPGSDAAGTELVAARILSLMKERGIQVNGDETLPLAMSLGCAVFPDDALLKNDLLSHADAALYEVKRHGGNGVLAVREPVAAQAPPAPPSTTFGALQGLVNAVDTKDRYTREHSETVTEYALLLARQLGLSVEVCSALRVAGLLHDIGKIGIPDQILRKPGRLSEDEYRIMQQHVSLSEMIIKEVPHLVDVISAVASHHERYDGCGYPRGLAGDQIPLMGRIMAIADACSAMLLDRPYRKGLIWDEVVVELRRGKGTQFDPLLVEPFIRAMEQSPLHQRIVRPD